MVTMSGVRGGRIMPLKSVTAVAPRALSIQKLEWPRKVSWTVPAASAASAKAAGTTLGPAPAIGKHCARLGVADPNAQTAAEAAMNDRLIGAARIWVHRRCRHTDHIHPRARFMAPASQPQQDLAPAFPMASFARSRALVIGSVRRTRSGTGQRSGHARAPLEVPILS